MLFNVLNGESVAGLIGLVPAHLPRTDSLSVRARLVCRCCVFGRCKFLIINISQGSIATPFMCGGVCNDFIANFMLNVTVKEF